MPQQSSRQLHLLRVSTKSLASLRESAERDTCDFRPELDIWCIGLTVLSLLIGRRYPIGASHKDLNVMARGIAESLQELRTIGRDRLSRHSRPLQCNVEYMQIESDWRIVIAAVTDFLHMDGSARMLAFSQYKLDDTINQHVAAHKLKVKEQRCESSMVDLVPVFRPVADIRRALQSRPFLSNLAP